MKILFISSNRLGDGAISTAALTYFIDKYPDSKITVACGSLTKDLYAQFPNVAETITLKKEKRHGHWIKLWKQVVKTRWDIVVDLRNSAVSRLIWGGQKYIWGKSSNPNSHKIEQIAEFIKADKPLYTKLVFSDDILAEATNFIKDGEKVLGICPTSNWTAKTWEVEKFIELIKKLDTDYNYDKIAVITGPGEEEIGMQVLESIPQEKRIDVTGKKASPVVAAAILSKCALYIGNDSGLMHCAAACVTPTLGLFGPTNHINYSPWGEKADFITTGETYTKEQQREYVAKYKDDPNAPSLMTSLTVDMVYAKAKELVEKYK